MSEKNNTNSDSYKEEEFLKKEVSKNSICPKCNRVYEDENILFCYYDGTKLSNSNQSAQNIVQKRTNLPPVHEFTGFELNLQNTSHNIQIPIEIIQSTTRLIQTNPKMPVDTQNVKTWFFSIPSPKKKRNFISKLVNHVGFSRTNLVNYLICYLLVFITYYFWITRPENNLLEGITLFSPITIGIILFTTTFTVILLILPILSLGYNATEILQASRKDFYLKLEPTLFIMIIILNYIIFRFNGPIPLLIIPGEPKVKAVPPIDHIVKSLNKSIIVSLVLVAGISIINGAILLQQITVSPFIKTNIQIMAFFGLTILILELIPFGNAIGKILLRHKPMTFYLAFTTVSLLLMSVLAVQ
jgi:hypothetical protein